MQKQHSKLYHLVSVRGLAAWLVVFYHSIALLKAAFPQLPNTLLIIIDHGYLAVDFFFVLSGFIIFINYHGNFSTNFRRSALAFYWNRISRIYPVHLIMLVAYLALAMAFVYASASHSAPPGYTVAAFMESLLLIQAWTGNQNWWNVPSWSISAEWFIYLLFPVIAIFFARYLRDITRHLFIAVSALAGLYLAYAFQELDSLGAATFGMALTRVFFEFSLGAIAGSLFVHYRAFLEKNNQLTGITLFMLCMATPFMPLPNYATFPLICFLSLLFLSVDTSFISKALSWQPLVYLGEISYSTYMVHYFVYDVFKAGWVSSTYQVIGWQLLTSFICVFILSILMHRVIEVPAQQFLRVGLPKSFRAAIKLRN